MKDEIIDLALKGAQATVDASAKLIGTAAWESIKSKIVQLWGVPDENPDAAAARDAVDDLDPGNDREGIDAAVGRWTARYAALLAERPQAADALQTLVGDISKQVDRSNNRGNVSVWFTGRSLFNHQLVMGDHGSYVKSSTVGASALLLLIALLVSYLVLRPDKTAAESPAPTGTAATMMSSPSARMMADSCGGNLPAIAEPAPGADDTTNGQSYTYKVGSASGDGRILKPGRGCHRGTCTQVRLASVSTG